MKRAIPLVVLAVVLSSCTVRFDSNTTVREDGSGTLAFEISLDDELRQLMAESGEGVFDFTGDLSDVPPGWETTEFARDGFEGVRISVDFASIAELDSRLGELAASAAQGQSAPTFVETSGLRASDGGYEFRVVLEDLEEGLTDAAGGSGDDEFGFEGFDPAALFGDVFEIRYVLTLPGEITSHNADVIEGSTMTWNIGFTDNGRVLEASSSAGGSGAPIGMILAILAVMAALVVGFVLMQASRRRRVPQAGWNETKGGDEPVHTAVAADPFGGAPDTGTD